MNRPGSPDTPPEQLDEAESRLGGRRPPLHIILLGVLALALAVFIATQVLGILYAIVLPPPPPLPDAVTVISHTNTAYGVDEWLYSTISAPCQVVIFYEEQGSTCRTAPGWCALTDQPQPDESVNFGGVYNQHVALCSGASKFSIFAMSWDVAISTGSGPDELTNFRIAREIYWTGGVPPRPQS